MHSGTPVYPDLAQLASIQKIDLDLDCPACPPAHYQQPPGTVCLCTCSSGSKFQLQSTPITHQ